MMTPRKIGEVDLSVIVERDGPWRNPDDMFPTADPKVSRAHLAGMEPFVYDASVDKLVITYQSYVLRTPHHNVLIDTCTGEDKGYPAPMDFPKQPWLDGLAAHGLGFEDIDYVFCTHLHIDHCGWNTRLIDGRWVPTFPNAKYIFSKGEYDAWAAEHEKGANPPGTVWEQNCLPIVEAGQALLVNDDFQLDDSLWLTPSPGHSPNHVCVNLASGGETAIFTGDMMHHALQVIEPDWSSCFCWDAAESSATRRRVLESLAETDTLVCPAHFPGTTVGHIVGTPDGGMRYRFDGAG